MWSSRQLRADGESYVVTGGQAFVQEEDRKDAGRTSTRTSGKLHFPVLRLDCRGRVPQMPHYYEHFYHQLRTNGVPVHPLEKGQDGQEAMHCYQGTAGTKPTTRKTGDSPGKFKWDLSRWLWQAKSRNRSMDQLIGPADVKSTVDVAERDPEPAAATELPVGM